MKLGELIIDFRFVLDYVMKGNISQKPKIVTIFIRKTLKMFCLVRQVTLVNLNAMQSSMLEFNLTFAEIAMSATISLAKS